MFCLVNAGSEEGNTIVQPLILHPLYYCWQCSGQGQIGFKLYKQLDPFRIVCLYICANYEQFVLVSFGSGSLFDLNTDPTFAKN